MHIEVGSIAKNELGKLQITKFLDEASIQQGKKFYLHSFFFSSRRRHTRSVSAFLLNRSSDLRKRSSPNVFEMAATETITSIILIKLIRVSLGTVRHPRRFKIVVIDIQITLKQMLRDFIGIRVNRAKKSGMVNITSSVNSR